MLCENITNELLNAFGCGSTELADAKELPMDSPIKDLPIVFSLNELFHLPVGEVWKIWKTESYDVPILAYSLCKKSITCVKLKGELFA